MAKRNYTMTGAARACRAIQGKLLKLFQDGHMSSKQYISLEESIRRIHNKIGVRKR